ncbi:hypothetical protein COLO4_10850 [Corchorus olitorius]|uniref:Uncharacterized protein n=1 Tax=Corchorus olitorius TaxID=93759 RepID=A0A1R3K6L4_9ROSI|nr:hypothetical protein COLO4_10850 [Corchorus olitorius]
MQNEGSNGGTTTASGDHCGNLPEPDLEKQGNMPVLPPDDRHPGLVGDSACEAIPTLVTIVVSKGESQVTQQPISKLSKDVDSVKEELPRVASPRKGYFSRTSSCHEQCRAVAVNVSAPESQPSVGKLLGLEGRSKLYTA